VNRWMTALSDTATAVCRHAGSPLEVALGRAPVAPVSEYAVRHGRSKAGNGPARKGGARLWPRLWALQSAQSSIPGGSQSWRSSPHQVDVARPVEWILAFSDGLSATASNLSSMRGLTLSRTADKLPSRHR
jgi:hypothetical protein